MLHNQFQWLKSERDSNRYGLYVLCVLILEVNVASDDGVKEHEETEDLRSVIGISAADGIFLFFDKCGKSSRECDRL